MPHQTVTGDIQKPTEGFTQDLVNSGSSLFEHQQGVLRNQQDQISRSISEKYAGADANIQNKHEIGLNDVAKKAEIDASAATKEARNNALHAINQPTENGVGVMLANNVLKDGAIDSAIKWLKDNPPTKPTVLNKETFGDYLSRNAHDVRVDFYKETQYYSHVIHLVSRVSGDIDAESDPIKTYIDTFPAGTLSGAPKVRAMQLITDLERHNRGAYGGCIGFIGMNGDLNQAITIRSFVSRGNTLYYQAGAGIVAKSDDERELQEVNNKLGALKKAIDLAEKLIN